MGVYQPQRKKDDGSMENIKFPLEIIDGISDINLTEINISDEVTENGDNLVTSKGIYDYVNTKVGSGGGGGISEIPYDQISTYVANKYGIDGPWKTTLENQPSGNTFPALLPNNGSPNWIRVASTSNYGIIPYTSGNAGSGKNNIGTSTWYFKYAYIDEIYGVNVRASSDMRLKTNIKKNTYDLTKILDQIDIKQFTWKSDDNNQINVGCIAQELRDILPEDLKRFYVGEDDSENHYLSINESKLVYPLIQAYQEEKAKRIELEERLKKIEERLGL